MDKNGELIEKNLFGGYWYGSVKKNVGDVLDNLTNVIMEIDLNGVKSFQELFSNVISIFIKVDLKDLRQRLLDRDRSQNIEDIEKRKPKYASAEFWGGEKDKWENGKKVGKESIAGWYHEMCWKTIYRAAYNSVTIDGKKIDQSFLRMAEIESGLPENKEVNLPAPNTKILPENSEVKKEPELKQETEEKPKDLPNQPNF